MKKEKTSSKTTKKIIKKDVKNKEKKQFLYKQTNMIK